MATIVLGAVVTGAGQLGFKNRIVTGIGLFVVVIGVSDKVWQVFRPPEEQRRRGLIQEYVEALQEESRNSPYATLQTSKSPYAPLQTSVPDLMARYVKQILELRPEPRAHSEESSRGEAELSRPEVAGALEALARRNLVIEAGPGGGKSSLLHYLSWTLASRWQDDPRSHVPVLLTAPRLAHSSEGSSLAVSIWEGATKQLGMGIRPRLPKEFFERRPGKRNAWVVLVDGLDAIFDERARRTLVGHLGLEGGRRDSPYRFVVTSRPLPELDALQRSGFARFRLQPFAPKDLGAFATGWFGDRTIDGQLEASLFTEFVQSSRMGDLARVPLLLTLAAITFEPPRRRADAQRGPMFPTTRAALYKTFVTRSIEGSVTERNREDFRRQWERQLGRFGADSADRLFNDRRELLELAARWQQDGGTGSLVQQAARAVQERGWPTHPAPDEAWLQEQMLGLLVSTGLGYRQADDFVFLHDSIREFLAASREVSERPDPWDELAWILIRGWRTPRRREVALFALGLWSLHGKDVTALIERIRSSHGLLFSATGVAEGAKVHPASEQEILRALQGEIGAIPYPYALDLKVLIALCRRSGQAQPVIAIARDREKHAYIRTDAARALAEMGRPEEAFPVLIEVARDRDQNTFTRTAAIQALAGMGRTKKALPVLMEVARDRKQDPRIRMEAARALAELGKPEEVLPVLIEVARDRKQLYWDRKEAIQTLAGMGGPEEVLPVLIEVARDREQDNSVRSEAVQALAGIGRLGEAFPVLIEVARDREQDARLRMEAAQALAGIGRPEEALPVFMEVARDREQDPSVRMEAGQALAGMGRTEEALPVFMEIARDRAAYVRDAFQFLAGMGRAEEALPVLMEIAPDRRQPASARLDAAQALAELGRLEEALPVLIELRDQSQIALVRTTAAQVLGELGRLEEALPALLVIARDREQDAFTRKHAARALAELGQPEEALPVLMEIARDRDEGTFIRTDAIRALAELGQPEEALPVLMEIARDREQDPQVRMEAGRALAGMGGH